MFEKQRDAYLGFGLERAFLILVDKSLDSLLFIRYPIEKFAAHSFLS